MTTHYRSPRSFDDLAVGDELESYGRTITDADIILFTGIAGIKLPIFLDEEYCKKHTKFGGRIVPGPLLYPVHARTRKSESDKAALMLKFSASVFRVLA